MPTQFSLFKPTAAELKKLPREREIRTSLQNKILTGLLPSGTALPSMQVLARLWKSNYFTVYQALTPLVREGLLVRKKGVGTRVAETRRTLQTVGIYYGADIISKPQHGYAVQLHRLLHQALTREGLKMHTWLDPRELAESAASILPEIAWSVEHQHVQAVIALMTRPEHLPHFERLGVPVVYFSNERSSHNVYLSHREFLTKALATCRERGRLNVAMIASPSILTTSGRTRQWTEKRAGVVFANLCKTMGLKTSASWFHLVDSGSLTVDAERAEIEAAYFKLLSNPRRRPDAVIIYPDNNLVTLSRLLAERQLTIDENLLVVSHRNEPTAFHLPVGPLYIALSLKSVADSLVGMVKEASAGGKCESLPGQLVSYDTPGEWDG